MSAAVSERLRRGPPLASIESLLSFEAKSTPRSEFGVLTSDLLVPNNFRFTDWGGMEAIPSIEDFQNLGGEKQTEEIFKLLALLSPFASEIANLKSSIDSAISRIKELDNRTKYSFPSKCHLTGADNDDDDSDKNSEDDENGGACDIEDGDDCHNDTAFCLAEPDSPHSGTPLLVETMAPDPFIIQKSRQLNRRVILNVGGIRHEVMWKMLEQESFSSSTQTSEYFFILINLK